MLSYPNELWIISYLFSKLRYSVFDFDLTKLFHLKPSVGLKFVTIEVSYLPTS